MTENPQNFEQKLESFYNTDVTEKQKAENFLNLIMENEDDRQIYMDRWESVKDSQIFEKNTKIGFETNICKKNENKLI